MYMCIEVHRVITVSTYIMNNECGGQTEWWSIQGQTDQCGEDSYATY